MKRKKKGQRRQIHKSSIDEFDAWLELRRRGRVKTKKCIQMNTKN
jgi:hypothetical protein